MATPKKKTQKARKDGLRADGKCPHTGKLRYVAVLRKKAGGKFIVDTERIVLADSRGEAMVAAEKLLAELVDEKLGLRAKSRIRMDTALAAWLPTLRKGTRDAYGSHTRRIAAALGADRYLHTLDAQELQRVIATAQVSDKTASQIRVAAIALLEWAKGQGYVASNVARDTTKRRTRKSGEQQLAEARALPVRKAMTMDELERFLLELQKIDPDVYALAGTQFYLGCRFGEVSALRWESINFRTGEVRIEQAQYEGEMGPPKNGTARVAGLGPDWLTVLMQHKQQLTREGRAGSDVWCFPAKPHYQRKRTDPLLGYQHVHTAFRRAMRTCGIDVGPATHALRHTMITLSQLAAQDGFALVAQRLAGVHGASKELQAAVGHADARMTAHYTEVPAATVVNFAAHLEARLQWGGRLGGKPSKDGEKA
jgi:integrase